MNSIKEHTKQAVINIIEQMTDPREFIGFVDLGLKGLITPEMVNEFIKLALHIYGKHNPQHGLILNVNSTWGKYYNIIINVSYTINNEHHYTTIRNTNEPQHT